MAIVNINLGVSPNDGNGDPLRVALGIVNDNFGYHSAILDNKVEDSDFIAEQELSETRYEELLEALEDKADKVTTADPSEVVPHFDLPQTIINSERAQLVANTGGYITLMFPLIADTTTITTVTKALPFLPDAFYMVDLFVTLNSRTVGTGGALQLSFALKQGATTLAGASTTTVTGTAKVAGTVLTGTKLIPKDTANSLEVTVSNSETGAPVAQGLTLWVRGFWGAP